MFKFISLLAVLAFTACGSANKNEVSHLEGAITSSGLPRACMMDSIIHHTYQDAKKSTTIEFISKDKATYAVKGDDQRYVVGYTVNEMCELVLKDSIVPELRGEGRLFWMRYDGSQIFDTVRNTEFKKIK